MSDQDATEQPCQPCRGTGKVISNLGGSPSTVECPWCEGSGVSFPERDAQARHASGRSAENGA